MLQLSIAKKIILVAMAALLLAIWSIHSDYTAQLKNHNRDTLRSHASTIAAHFQKYVSDQLEQREEFLSIRTGLTEQVRWMRQHLPYQKMLSHIGIVATTGRILSHTNTNLVDQHLPESTIRELSSTRKQTFFKENGSYHFYTPLIQDDKLYGFVLIGFSESAIEENIGKNFQNSLFTLAKAITIFIVIIGIFLFFCIDAPFKQILKDIESIVQSENLSLRVEFQSKDEAGQIAQKINLLLGLLGQKEKDGEVLSKKHEEEILHYKEWLNPLEEATQTLCSLLPQDLIAASAKTAQDEKSNLQTIIEAQPPIIEERDSSRYSAAQLNKQKLITIATDIIVVQKILPHLLKLAAEGEAILQEVYEDTPYPEQLLNEKTADFQLHKVRFLEPPQDAPARVVIFDDFEMTRFAYAKTLENDKDFEVVGSFSNADNFVGICKELSPHLVLMDIDMHATMNGIDATQALTTLFPHVCVVILSIHRSPYFITRALAAGARAYLSKKTSLAKLSTILKMSLDNCIVINEASAIYYLNYQKFSEIFTSTEMRVFMEMLEGYTAKEIAEHLGSSSKTVENHIHNILRKSHTSREDITRYFTSI